MDNFRELLARINNSDEQAAAELWDEYFNKLVNYARNRLVGMPRRASDEEDVALSAMNSFFRGAKAGRFDIQERDEIWKLLATITVRKAMAHQARHFAAKRGGGTVRGESVFGLSVEDLDKAGINNVMDEKRLPAMSLRLSLTCREMIDQIREPISKQIAILRLEGYTNQEIAQKLDCSLATVKRKLAIVRDDWSSSVEEP